jgi:succinyl-CoA synthetase beta subunit
VKIHEYQGKQILREFGVPVPRGEPAFTVDEAVEAAKRLGGPVWVVKAQIHAGGRGKGGGVKVAKSIEEVREKASQILGMQLITHQTGAMGQEVRRLFIEDGADIKKELYVSMVVDRGTQRIALLASSEGGMDIEEVAHKNPDAIKKVFIDPGLGLTDAQCDEVSGAIGIPAASFGEARKCLQGLYKAFVEKDASLAEINPLIVSGDGKVIALDAKFNFDSNALFRHPDIVAMRDLDEEDPAEIEASKFDLAYISLDGDIGCLVNGAGLAMSTMDTIKLYGGEPANFLDVGGGATTEKVTEAFKIMLKNPNLKAILVNIFGGIMKCDTIAEGVVAASKAVGLKVPLVVRMKGTNEDLGKKILAESGLPIITANNMGEAAEKVVAAAKAYKPVAAASLGVAAASLAAGAASVASSAAPAVAASVNTAATATNATTTAANAAATAANAAATAATAAATTASRALEPSAPIAGWMKWLALVVSGILAALLLRTCTQSKEAPKAVEPPKPAATAPVAPAPVAVEAPKAAVAAPVAAKSAAEAFKAGAKSFKLDVEFDTGSAKIRGDAVKDLNELAELIKDGKTKGEIAGHTDNVGDPAANLKLSQARAESVVAYLVAKGVPKEALAGKGYGDTKPVAANDTNENKQRNRRVEFAAQ